MQSDITREKLRSAFKKLQLAALQSKRDGKKIRVSIAEVARVAGCSNALIHNKYPEIAEEIRAANGESAKEKKEKQADTITQYKSRNRELTLEVNELKSLLKNLGSKNATLLRENKRLQVEIDRLHQGIRTIPQRT